MHLEPLQRDHVDDLAAVFAEPDVWRFPYGRALTYTETVQFVDAQTEHWHTLDFGLWVARLVDTGTVIGYAGLSVPRFLPEILPAVEVGWRIHPDHWGRGLASEAARAALREGFTSLGLAEICSLPQAVNPRSYAVCERIGMRFERTVTCPATDRRGAVEARMYECSAGEWHRLVSHHL